MTNKQRLLSFISKWMHDFGEENESYSLNYVTLLSHVDSYVKKRASIIPQKILDDFIKRSILFVDEDNNVRFKSSIFFHYFLALHFDYDKEFKAYVFTEDNYLNYFEEISYYTGIKRDDEDVLKFTQKHLLDVYSNTNKKMREDYKKIDEILEPNNKKGILSFQIDEDKMKNKLTEEQLDDIYDNTLANIPIKNDIESKSEKQTSINNIDKVLKLSSIVLKNSEDVDDYSLKSNSYSNIIESSMSFLMIYRDSLVIYFNEFKEIPSTFPKNIDFHLFIKFLPLIHQVVVYDWLGSQKLRPIILDKIKKDKQTLNVSDFEKFMSIFLYSDIRGKDYPEFVKEFVKKTKYKYIKDTVFLKVLSYYNLRKNSPELDKKWLNLLAEIKNDLGKLPKSKKGIFIEQIKGNKEK